MKITIIGVGNMGTAFARGLLESFAREKRKLELVLSDPNTHRPELDHLEVILTSNNTDAVKNAEVVILAVKPKDIPQVCEQIAPYIQQSLVISIAAGIKLQTLQKALSHQVATRVMPNLLANIGESMSVWYSTPSASQEQKKLIRLILSAVGKELELQSEDAIDRATAISGSGPAYVWKFMESMIAAGQKIGLTEQQSYFLTTQTFLGASKLALLGVDDVKTLRERVTSKGGTTEQALKVFEEKQFSETITDAVEAAYKRAKELGQ